jgi:transketolase
MRRTFVKYLESKIEQDPSILLITADLGYGLFDNIKEKYPNNFINCGASEQLMIGLCVGAAYEGKKPIAYSITPFLLYRPVELLRNYVNKEKLNIKLIGSGRDKDYSHDGFSHWAEEDKDVMLNSFKNIKSYWPEMDNITQILDEVFDNEGPYYVNLKR